jgi:peptide/nickel transport system permease protein
MRLNNNKNNKSEIIELDKNLLRQYRREQIKSVFIRFFGSKLAVIGGSIVLFFIIIAIFADYLAPIDPLKMDTTEILASLSKFHPFGTDEFGRDTLSRVIYGARVSMRVGFISTSIAVFLGVLIGGIAGFYGGLLDNILMRIMDAVFSFPAILLAIVMVAALGPGINNAMIAIGIVYTPIFARIVRSSVISNKRNDYVEAAKALGQSNLKILFSEIIPNCASIIIVQATVTFAEAIIFESGLSFIGLGAQPPTPSWGKMLSDARGYMDSAPFTAIFPGVAISLAVLGFNLLGDGLRDILDPRLHRTAL